MEIVCTRCRKTYVQADRQLEFLDRLLHREKVILIE